MRAKDIFARASGGIGGAVLAIAVPHIGCLGALVTTFVGIGAGAQLAVGASYAAGRAIAAGGAAAAYYGIQPSRELCCQLWGETRAVRVKKALAVSAFAFAAVAGFNTLNDKGLPLDARAQVLEQARDSGQSVWQMDEMLNSICGSAQRTWFSWFTP